MKRLLFAAALSLVTLATVPSFAQYTLATEDIVYAPLSAPSVLTTDNDDGVFNIAFPFEVTFYENSYTTAAVGANGAITFPTSTFISTTNPALGSTSGIENFIAPFWDDLRLFSANGGYIGTQESGVAPNRSYAIEWNNIGRYNDTSYTMSFLVRFYEGDDRIDVEYGPNAGTDFLSGTMGMEDSAAENEVFFGATDCGTSCNQDDFAARTNKRLILRQSCGDSVLDVGEACDDGNRTGGDGCSARCELEFCGNAFVDFGETCDDGNTAGGDGCAADCTSNETCGNGITDRAVSLLGGGPGDDAIDGSGSDISNADFVVQQFIGAADLEMNVGDAITGYQLRLDGTITTAYPAANGGFAQYDVYIGVAAGEPLADDLASNFVGAATQVRAGALTWPAGAWTPRGADPVAPWGPAIMFDTPYVYTGGDLLVEVRAPAPDEDLVIDALFGDSAGSSTFAVGDPAATTATDGPFDDNYAMLFAIDRLSESCDDGNTADGDGCSALCAFETCGNGVVDPGEACDDGNSVDGDGCAAGCDSDESCGNGVLDGTELCDDGNAADGDGCSALCTYEVCGNGALDPGEFCDDGNTTDGDGCSSTCGSDETCGNSVVDVSVGEACDDGNSVDGDGCSALCALPSCGDGVVDAGEACDDGNTTDADGCSATCMSNETCGNGTVDSGESCDDAGTTSGDGCSATCAFEMCGNGIVDPGEVCDDGNTDSGDGCSALCLSDETCGNDVRDSGEACDDGNTTSGDGCSTTCGFEACGNGVLDAGEVCDDGNREDGDGCSAGCASDETCGNGVHDLVTAEVCDDGNTDAGDGCSAACDSDETCGNGTLDAGEVCDDGNTIDGDGCSALCASGEACGNGVIDGLELCDDGNTDSGDGCSATCDSDETCGNAVIDAGEACDDSNLDAGDGCSPECQYEDCGNGTVDADEICDDGNTDDGDGCSSGCSSDETCGNTVVDLRVGEACDDGNTDDGDGCSSACALPACGDGFVDAGEACDDGNTDDSDGCSATCMSDESCGNRILDGSEQCDDGNTEGGDSCSASCEFEVCGNGTVDPGEMCDDGNTDDGDGCASTCSSDETCGNGAVDIDEQCDDGEANIDDGATLTCATDCTLNVEVTVDGGRVNGGGGCASTRASGAPVNALLVLGLVLGLRRRRR